MGSMEVLRRTTTTTTTMMMMGRTTQWMKSRGIQEYIRNGVWKQNTYHGINSVKTGRTMATNIPEAGFFSEVRKRHTHTHTYIGARSLHFTFFFGVCVCVYVRAFREAQ